MPVDYTFLLDASARDRIQIAKLGAFADQRYGDFKITPDEVQAWSANLSRLPGGRAPIDFDHRADKPGAARNTEAAGWITGVELADGVPMATVDWTDKGREAIESKRYLFISPTYGPWTDETGTTTPDVLQGAALTNKPFLNMAPVVNLSRAEDLFAEEIEPTTLDVLTGAQRKDLPASDFVFPDTRRYPIPDLAHARDALARSAGKPEEAQVKAAVHKRYPALAGRQMGTDPGSDSRPHMPEITAKILERLGLDESADEATILAAIPEPRSLDQLAADAGKVVLDKDDHDKLKRDADTAGALTVRLEAIESERADEKFAAAFDRAQRRGAVDAKDETRELHRKIFDTDSELAIRNLDALPDNAAVPVTARGAGGELPEGEAPAGVDADAYELDRKVQAHMAAEKAAGREANYLKSLEAVRGEA